ncbi:MAG: RHS repeat-associated core domain-containing protein, partial [Bacteroidota bacterium]
AYHEESFLRIEPKEEERSSLKVVYKRDFEAKKRCTGFERYGYQGKESLDEEGLDTYDFHARYYDPALGRFTTVDPQHQFMSGYVGMGNNPVMMVDPDGEFAFLAALPLIAKIGIGVGAGLGAYQGAKMAEANGGNVFLGALGGFAIGGIAGIASAGVGSAVAGGTGFLAGATTGLAAGATGGFINGVGMTALGGSSLHESLGAGFKGALIGGAFGGAIGGVSSGIQSVKHGGNFWSGKGATFDVGAIAVDGTGDPIEYSNKSVKDFSDDYFGEVKGLNELHADGTLPSNKYTTDGTKVFNSRGKEVYGTTKYLGGRKSDVFMYKGAFANKETLYLNLGHEYIHVAHGYAGLREAHSLKDFRNFSEHAAHSWMVKQGRMLGVLEHNRVWKTSLPYLNKSFYNSSFDYKKFMINPFLNGL